MSFNEGQNQSPHVSESEQAGPAYLEMVQALREAEVQYRDKPLERSRIQSAAYEKFLLSQVHQGVPWL